MWRVLPRAWAIRASIIPPGACAPFSMAEMTVCRVPARLASSVYDSPALVRALYSSAVMCVSLESL